MNVGIWWDSGDTIVAIFHPHTENSTCTLHRYDSNYMHAEQWASAADRLGRTHRDEYFCVPRGRVVYDARNDCGIIYHGPSFSQERIDLIARQFNLNRWIATVDLHYSTGADADALFDDDYDSD
jgi:hypothetical protein